MFLGDSLSVAAFLFLYCGGAAFFQSAPLVHFLWKMECNCVCVEIFEHKLTQEPKVTQESKKEVTSDGNDLMWFISFYT